MKIFIVTAFPEMIESYLNVSMIRKSSERGLVSYYVWDLRDFTMDRHKQIDDLPYGGGAGMVLKPEPFFRAYDRLEKELGKSKPRVIYPSPQGKVFNQSMAKELAREDDLTFFCGHYKGIDERVIKKLVTDEISIGDFIVSGGELPALLIIDAIVRCIPGVLHSYESAETDSFMDNLLEGPIYTRPQKYRGLKVPKVLLSGDHRKIAEWRGKQRIKRTAERRGDLFYREHSNENSGGEDG